MKKEEDFFQVNQKLKPIHWYPTSSDLIVCTIVTYLIFECFINYSNSHILPFLIICNFRNFTILGIS